MASDRLLRFIDSGAASSIPATLRALRKARIWCLPVDDVVDRLVTDPLVPWDERRLLIGRLAAEQLSSEHEVRLLTLVERLESVGARRGRPTGAVFVTLREVLQLLPRDQRVPRFLAYLRAIHWQQRAMACRALRDEALDSQEVAAICVDIQAMPNRFVVELAARVADRLTTGDATQVVLPHLQSEYWQSKVIEQLLPRPGVDVSELATRWPMGVLWAIGRTRRGRDLKAVIERLPQLESDWRRLPIVAWALGRVRATSELDALEGRMRATAEWRTHASLSDGTEP